MRHQSLRKWCFVISGSAAGRQRENYYLPKFCGDVINLLLVLQDLLTVSLEQQGGHTQVVGVEPFELVIKRGGLIFREKNTRGQSNW